MRIGLYAHGGSGNHGCEALVRSTVHFLGEHDYSLFSERPEEDFLYGLDKLAQIVPSQTDLPKGIGRFAYAVHMKLKQDDRVYWHRRYRDFGKKVKDLDLALAIGGDNYCYRGFTERFSILNRTLAKRNVPLVLWGCSIDKDRINPAMLEDLRLYRFIVARESLTYHALKEVGVDRVVFMPDTAFLLDAVETPLPTGFVPGNMVGLNISPLVIRQEPGPGSVLRNCRELINYILNETEMGVALIPHVTWRNNDDREPLSRLYEEYASSGRIVLIGDADAPTLKGIIRRCRFIVASRTHATIAGYSTGVPTLAIGYSVKSRGIATDLFGTADHYVLPIEEMKEEDVLTKAFQWLLAHEEKIHSLYDSRLDAYLSLLDKSILNGRI